MKVTAVVVELEGTSAISFSRVVTTPKMQGETPDAYEERTWRERLHTDVTGQVVIPGNMLKESLAGAAKYLAETVPGKKNATYTKHFDVGVVVADHAPLGIQASDVAGERLFVPADGKRGSGKRVWKIFPVIPAGWRASFRLFLLDPVLADKPHKVIEYLGFAGRMIGLGRWRRRAGGMYGAFRVVSHDVEVSS